MNRVLSDARSEMKYARIEKQKVQTWPSVNQIEFLIAWNSTCRSQVYENSRREQIMLHAELDNRERELFRKLVLELFRNWKMRKICCTEAERPQQVRVNELSRQERESQSTVNQLTVQIQGPQHKVNSLNDSREFYPETASSSGLSHVPSHPVSVRSPCGMLSRDFCLLLDTRNFCGTSGNVFEDLLAPIKPATAS